MTGADKRRKVAERIRGIIPIELYGYESLYSGICNEVAKCIGFDKNPDSVGDFLDRLADLIDPTCHMSVEEVAHRPTLNAMAVCVYECDRCHAVSYIGEVCCYPEPRYCPNCGARVVSSCGRRIVR